VWGTTFALLILIGGAAYMAYQNVGWFKEVVDSLALALTDDAGAMGYVYDAIRDTFGQGVADFLNPFLNWFMKAIPLVKDLGRAIVVAFTEDKGAIGIVYDVIRKLFGNSVAEFVQPFLEKLRLFIPVLQDIGVWVGHAFEDLFRGDIRNTLIDLSIAFQDLTGIDVSGFTAAMGDFFDKLSKGDISGALGPLGPLFDTLSDFFDKLSKGDIEGALGPLGEGFHSMKDALEKIGGALASLWPHPLEDMLNGFVALVKTGEDNGPSAVQKGFDALGLTLQTVVGFVNGVAKGFDDIVTAMGKVGDEIKTNPLLQDALGVVLGAVAGYLLAIGINAGIAAFGVGAAAIASGALAIAAGAAALATGLLAAVLAILASPFIIIMILVGGLIGGLIMLYRNNENFRTSVDNLWEGLKKLGGYLGTGCMQALDALDSTKWKFKPNFQIGPFHWDESGAWFEDPRKMVTDWIAAFQGAQTSNPAPVDLGAGSTTGGSALSQTLDALQATRAANIAAREAADAAATTQVSPNPTITRALGGWLREPVVGVVPSGTLYMLHANEFVSPAGGLSAAAAAAHGGYGGGGGVNLNVSPGAVVINGSDSATSDIAAAADGLWDDLYAKLPIGAAALEGELARSGRLAVRSTVAGQLIAKPIDATELTNTGCHQATHYVSAISVGAFQLLSGAMSASIALLREPARRVALVLSTGCWRQPQSGRPVACLAQQAGTSTTEHRWRGRVSICLSTHTHQDPPTGDIACGGFVEWRRSASRQPADPTATPRQDSTSALPGRVAKGNATLAVAVKDGDNLSFISKRVLGDAGRGNEIFEVNRDVIGDDPNRIQTGMVLTIPGGTLPDPDTSGFASSGAFATVPA
jgi:hypothetical protein